MSVPKATNRQNAATDRATDVESKPNEVNSFWMNEMSRCKKKQTQMGYQDYYQPIMTISSPIFVENGWICTLEVKNAQRWVEDQPKQAEGYFRDQT